MRLSRVLTIVFILNEIVFSSDLDYNFNYFGNFTLNSLDKGGYEFRSYQMDDIDNSLSFESYSKVGAQLNINNKNNLDFTLQAVARSYEDKIESDFSWLNLKYTKEYFALRVGRMQLPLFLNSNSLDIDYVNTWAKAPVEVYGIFPAKYYDGIELMFHKSLKDIYFEIQISPYGKLKENVSILDSIGEVTAKLDNIQNIMASIEISNFTIKSSFTQGRLTIPLDNSGLSSLSTTLNSLGFSDLANKYSFNNKRLRFYSFGVNYDNNSYFVDSEIVRMESDSFLPNMTAYYLLAGYRYKKFTPFIMYAENKTDESYFSEDALTTTSTNPYVVGSVAQIRAGLEQQLYQMNSAQKSSSLGLRYDHKKGIAFKLQVDRITTKNYGTPTSSGEYERLGFLARKSGVEDEPVYMFTLGFGFAF